MPAMQAQINEVEKFVISSSKQPNYAPPPLRKEDGSKTNNQDTQADDEKSDMDKHNWGKALAIADIYKI